MPLIISSMRINLVTPFAEKDAVKALGAKWDTARKVWYIVDVENLTPFLRWIPGSQAVADQKPPPQRKRKMQEVMVPSTGPAVIGSSCGCDALPWEDCEHTAGSNVLGLQ